MDTIKTNKMEQSKSNGSKITIIILGVLLAGLAFFAFYNYQSNKNSEETLLEQKLEIQADLDAKIVELDNAIASNTSMETELTAARDEIVAFRDSVKNLKVLKYQIIKRYKNKLAVLEETNNRLIKESNQLKAENQQLTVEVDSAHATVARHTQTIMKQTKKNDSLSSSNTILTEKVLKGAILKVGAVTALSMKERRNGEFKETSRAKKTSAFRISFVVRENAIADSGARDVHIVVKNVSGEVIGVKDSFTDINGNQIEYTDTTEIDYNKQDLEVIVMSEVPEDSLEKGDYYVEVYVENRLLGSTLVPLK